MQTSYVRTWYLFGVIPIWRTERALDDEDLRKRFAEMSNEFFVRKKEFKEQVKKEILEELSLAWRESNATAEQG